MSPLRPPKGLILGLFATLVSEPGPQVLPRSPLSLRENAFSEKRSKPFLIPDILTCTLLVQGCQRGPGSYSQLSELLSPSLGPSASHCASRPQLPHL